MTTSLPTFSAIIANYNHGHHIHRTLEATANQTVAFDEILVMDDGSTDNSVEIIETLIKDIPHARLIQNPTNMGVEATVNRAIQETTGDFVYMMSADDIFDVHIVEWCKQAAEAYPDVGMISGNVRLHNQDTGRERLLTLPFEQVMARYTLHDLEVILRKQIFTFYGGGNMIRRDAMIALQGVWPSLKWHADWLLYLLMAYRHPFAVIPHELMCVIQSKDQYSKGGYDWQQQRPVTEAFFNIMQQDYPEEYAWLKQYAILPTYTIQTLGLLLGNKQYRPYLSPLLIWRLLTYQLFRKLGRMVPQEAHRRLRKWLRI